jgi:hypothetical protein
VLTFLHICLTTIFGILRGVRRLCDEFFADFHLARIGVPCTPMCDTAEFPLTEDVFSDFHLAPIGVLCAPMCETAEFPLTEDV